MKRDGCGPGGEERERTVPPFPGATRRPAPRTNLALDLPKRTQDSAELLGSERDIERQRNPPRARSKHAQPLAAAPLTLETRQTNTFASWIVTLGSPTRAERSLTTSPVMTPL